MENKQIISTKMAPKAIGNYSQAIKVGTTIYISGQIPLIPEKMVLDNNNFKDQARRCFENLKAVAEAANSSLRDAVKVTIYLTDINNFSEVDDIMATYFNQPYPARTAISVKDLPKSAAVEVDAILELS